MSSRGVGFSIERWLGRSGGLLVLAGWLTLAAAGAGEVSVAGRVTDQSGNPVAQFPVVINCETAQAVSITDAEGNFAFYDLPSGACQVAPIYAATKSLDVQVGPPGSGSGVDVGTLKIEGVYK
jgi:hypothetical protein